MSLEKQGTFKKFLKQEIQRLAEQAREECGREGPDGKMLVLYLVAHTDVALGSFSIPYSQRKESFLKRSWKTRVRNAECFCCYERAIHMHHIVPLSKGGLNISVNLIPLCHPCHEWIHGFPISKLPVKKSTMLTPYPGEVAEGSGSEKLARVYESTPGASAPSGDRRQKPETQL